MLNILSEYSFNDLFLLRNSDLYYFADGSIVWAFANEMNSLLNIQKKSLKLPLNGFLKVVG